MGVDLSREDACIAEHLYSLIRRLGGVEFEKKRLPSQVLRLTGWRWLVKSSSPCKTIQNQTSVVS